MRGIGQTLSRLSAARALLASAAILASASAEQAYAEPQFSLSGNSADDTALAIPRVAPHGINGAAGPEVALPQPLTPSQAALIRGIFTAQAQGDIPAAVRETASLDTTTPVGQAMLGEILADRYLGRFTRPGAGDLTAWLTSWADLPDAPAIYSLLQLRLPRGQAAPPAPVAASLTEADDKASLDPPVPEETEVAGFQVNRDAWLDRAVLAAAANGRADTVTQLIAKQNKLSPAYASLLRGEAAQILFTHNRDAEAFAIARAGATICDADASPSCQTAALAGYIAGLAAWRMGQPVAARAMFEAAWHAPVTTAALQAGAAFWAARAHLRTGDYGAYLPWMQRAAQLQTTFYGLLARRGLGLSVGATGATETLAEADIDAVSATPEGQRAFALLQVGQSARADAELRRLWPQAQTTPSLGRAIMLVAARAGLGDLAAELADLVQTADGQPRAAMRFAVPHLHPAGGFTVDPAMVYALARTELNFDASMISSSGASGLLQIMPATARFIVHADGQGAAGGQGSASGLRDPAANLALGQRYVAYLASQDVVNGDLIRLLASYNSGPGNFAHWADSVHDDGDPLLFIEAIPTEETRNFVPRVLAYTWLYAARLDLPIPSLDELAGGEWPRYHAPDSITPTVARLH